jgi:hypothetical protein
MKNMTKNRNRSSLRNFRILILTFALALVVPANSFAASKVFYLDLKKGCYSYTSNGKGMYLIDSPNYKRLFKSTCAAAHHIEVIWAGKIKTSSANKVPTDAEVTGTCTAKYESVMGYSAPQEIVDDTPYLRWFYADAGAEGKKYGSKVICYLHLSDETYSNYLSVKGSLIGY